jgi:hypothetical protein
MRSKEGSINSRERPVIDSRVTRAEALFTYSDTELLCPQEILDLQEVVPVQYYSFDGLLHEGQIVIDKRLAPDIKRLFTALKNEKFPISSVIPVAHPLFRGSDAESMRHNNSSGFNHRLIGRKPILSEHALGWAIDLNPVQNPMIIGTDITPRGASYVPHRAGTITENSFIVRLMEDMGWEWGGRWQARYGMVDMQHFEKPLGPKPNPIFRTS